MFGDTAASVQDLFTRESKTDIARKRESNEYNEFTHEFTSDADRWFSIEYWHNIVFVRNMVFYESYPHCCGS